jgi:hypothetical protein
MPVVRSRDDDGVKCLVIEQGVKVMMHGSVRSSRPLLYLFAPGCVHITNRRYLEGESSSFSSIEQAAHTATRSNHPKPQCFVRSKNASGAQSGHSSGDKKIATADSSLHGCSFSRAQPFYHSSRLRGIST